MLWVTANWVSFELTIDCQQSVRQKGEYEPWGKNWSHARNSQSFLTLGLESFMETRSFVYAIVTVGLLLCITIPWLFF